jgi:putative endonuclease
MRSSIVGAADGAAQGAAPAQRIAAAGRRAEDLADEHQRRAGLVVLARNVRCRGGEVDLICADGRTIVFVEVRLRRNRCFGGAAASIGPAKQRRVALAASHWLAGEGRRYANRPCRFDAVLLDRLDGATITWLKAAFDAPGEVD